MKATKPTPEKFNLDNILTTFATDENARAFLESWLWPDGPVCPRCKGSNPDRIYKMTGKSTRPGLHNCKDCRRQFTVTVGTIFEDTHLPLRKWIIGLFLMASSKKGMSSLQFMRILGIGSYRTALYMTDRIRFALHEGTFESKLSGTVEIDECYFGPKAKRGPGIHKNKVAVIGMVERQTGQRRSFVRKHPSINEVTKLVDENIEDGTTINTDESGLYARLPSWYFHHTVCHQPKGANNFKGEYYRMEEDGSIVTTNFVESSFSLLRRGVIGTFHNLSNKYLPLYVAEFDHRFNHRKLTDGERMITMLQKTKGKRTTLKSLKGEARDDKDSKSQ